ncbi:hypothetical protein ACE6ED_20930 [Paenibacillus sp. CN-4]|uniref:hypothetical protein n=1 Tax=Paenibacillus nanchangensis TaxID=3348343 RepID=UPI00397AF95E
MTEPTNKHDDHLAEIDQAEQQKETMREFLESKSGPQGAGGPVNDQTGRLADEQNRLTTEHNQRK